MAFQHLTDRQTDRHICAVKQECEQEGPKGKSEMISAVRSLTSSQIQMEHYKLFPKININYAKKVK